MKDQIGPMHNLAHNLTIDPDRLWDAIMETAAIGATAKGGICRLTLTQEDRRVRDWFAEHAQAIGCTVTVDDMGNMFARRPGRRSDIPPIAMGSHLDTQPTGGKFDGVLGVLAALEASADPACGRLRDLCADRGGQFHQRGGLALRAGDDRVRGVCAACSSATMRWRRRIAPGFRSARRSRRSAIAGRRACGEHPLSAFFELHIEQGPILEREQTQIGVVTGVQGMRWYEATLTGQEAHTGATPMTLRKNALLGAARMIEAIDAIAKKHAPLAVGTVGLIEVKPNSRNVIPADVFFTVDFRHPESAVLDAMEQRNASRL